MLFRSPHRLDQQQPPLQSAFPLPPPLLLIPTPHDLLHRRRGHRDRAEERLARRGAHEMEGGVVARGEEGGGGGVEDWGWGEDDLVLWVGEEVCLKVSGERMEGGDVPGGEWAESAEEWEGRRRRRRSAPGRDDSLRSRAGRDILS